MLFSVKVRDSSSTKCLFSRFGEGLDFGSSRFGLELRTETRTGHLQFFGQTEVSLVRPGKATWSDLSTAWRSKQNFKTEKKYINNFYIYIYYKYICI